MGTINKTIYEAPTIHLKQVMMESDIMAASGDDVTKNADVTISTSEQADGGTNGTFNFSSKDWE